MLEIDVALTDYVLTVECFIFALILLGLKVKRNLKSSFLIIFLGFGFAAMIGGTVHGFQHELPLSVRSILWWLTLVFVGITAYGFARAGLGLLQTEQKSGMQQKYLLSGLIIYIFLTYMKPLFLIAILFYIPATLLTLTGFIYSYRRTHSSTIKWGIYGLVLSLIAPLIQQLKVSFPSIYITHNTVYHVILMISVYLFFLGTKAVLMTRDL